jgi:hypothetical protein
MRSIRTFAYSAFLMLGAFSIQPSLANAQEANGHFTLTHEVHWGNQILAAGEYLFSAKSAGPSEMLVLRNVNGDQVRSSTLMLVNDVETSDRPGLNRLTLTSRNGQSFVCAMELPEFDMVLHFKVPEDSR